MSSPENSGDFTFFLQIPPKSPTLWGHLVGKTTACYPHSLRLSLHCCVCLIYKTNPWYFLSIAGTMMALSPSSPGLGAVMTNDKCINSMVGLVWDQDKYEVIPVFTERPLPNLCQNSYINKPFIS